MMLTFSLWEMWLDRQSFQMVLQVQCEGEVGIIVPQVSPYGGQQYKFLYFCVSRNEDTDESHILSMLEKIIVKICTWKVRETKSEYFCYGASIILYYSCFLCSFKNKLW